MSFKGEFAEILREKIGEPQKTEAPKRENSPSTPLSLDWILPIFAPRKTWAPQEIPGAYPKVVITKSAPKKTETPIETKKENEQKVQVKELSDKAQKAHGILVKLGAQFESKDFFQPSELKTQYRKLARIYHPDSQNKKASNKHFNILSVCHKFIINEINQNKH